MAVVIETTLGDITVDLFVDQRPTTCLNFLKLCKMKYYNFNLFHTIQSGFIAQTGDPSGEGSGGQSIWGLLEGQDKRFFSGEKMPKIRHSDAGLLSMVSTGEMMIGSQFFFTLGADLDSLDGVHCVIGAVTEGHDVLRKLNDTICDESHRPFQDVRITHTVVLEDPFNDPPRLRAPSRSPSPSAERLKGGRIAPDEDIDELQGKSAVEIQEIIEEKEAKARATILEIIGDLPDADIAPPENVLFVCKLNPVTTDEDLEIIFSRFGKIISCEVIRDKKSGDSLQYAFIEFAEQKSCEDAYFKMDNVLIDDRRIHVDFSQSVSKIKWLGKGRGVKHINDDDNRHQGKNRSGRSHSRDRKSDYITKETQRDRENKRDQGNRPTEQRREEKRNNREERKRSRSRSRQELRESESHSSSKKKANESCRSRPERDESRFRRDNTESRKVLEKSHGKRRESSTENNISFDRNRERSTERKHSSSNENLSRDRNSKRSSDIVNHSHHSKRSTEDVSDQNASRKRINDRDEVEERTTKKDKDILRHERKSEQSHRGYNKERERSIEQENGQYSRNKKKGISPNEKVNIDERHKRRDERNGSADDSEKLREDKLLRSVKEKEEKMSKTNRSKEDLSDTNDNLEKNISENKKTCKEDRHKEKKYEKSKTDDVKLRDSAGNDRSKAKTKKGKLDLKNEKNISNSKKNDKERKIRKTKNVKKKRKVSTSSSSSETSDSSTSSSSSSTSSSSSDSDTRKKRRKRKYSSSTSSSDTSTTTTSSSTSSDSSVDKKKKVTKKSVKKSTKKK